MGETVLSGLQTPEARRAVAEALLALFRRWGVGEARQSALLGLETLEPLWAGEPLPQRREVLERAGHLLAVDRRLQVLFPDDPVLREDWAGFPNSALDGRSPLAVTEEGLAGNRAIRDLLEAA